MVHRKTVTDNENHANIATMLIWIRIAVWVALLSILGLELYSEKNIVGERGVFAMVLMYLATPLEIITDIYIIKHGIKGLKSDKRTQSILCLTMIPGTWLLVFLLFRLISIITGWQ